MSVHSTRLAAEQSEQRYGVAYLLRILLAWGAKTVALWFSTSGRGSECTTRAPGCAAASLLHRRTLLPHLLPIDTLTKQNLVSRRAKGQCMSASRRAHGQLESPRTGNHISDHYVAMKIGGMRYPRLVSVYESKSLACSLESERTYTGERNADRFR